MFVLFECWIRLSAFVLFPTVFFSPEASLNLLCSGYVWLWLWKSDWFWFLFLVWILFCFPCTSFFVWAPSAWNSSGHGEAVGLSFVSSNHSYWFEVWSNYGGFVLCKEGPLHLLYCSAWGCWELGVLGICAVRSLHSQLLGETLFWNSNLLRMSFWRAGGWRLSVQPGKLKGSRFSSLYAFSYFARGILPDCGCTEWWCLCSTCSTFEAMRKEMPFLALVRHMTISVTLIWLNINVVEAPRCLSYLLRMCSENSGWLDGQLQAVTIRALCFQTHAISSCLKWTPEGVEQTLHAIPVSLQFSV